MPVVLTGRELPPGWSGRSITTRALNTTDDVFVRRDGLLIEHEQTGLRAGGSAPFIEWVEVSLPRLLYGHNGRLITSQTELDAALQRLFDLLAEIGQPQPECLKFTRIDLVWHIEGSLDRFVQAFQHAKHKSVRRLASGYKDESLFWVGHAMRIRVYDKIKEVTKQPGDVLRVEVQLRGRLLKKYLADGGDAVQAIKFLDCYRTFRDILLGFTPARPPSISSWAQMFVTAQVAGWEIEGCTPFDLWSVGKNKQHVQRMRRQMAAARLEYFGFDFSTLLPVSTVPPIIEVDENGLRLEPGVATEPDAPMPPTADPAGEDAGPA